MTVSARAFPAFPKVSLPDLNGTSRPVLEARAGSWNLVTIGHSDCGTTRLVVPYLKRMHERRGQGSSVVLVLQDDAASARALLAGAEADMPVRLEPDPYPLARELGLTTVPTLFLVDPAGVVERAAEGFQRAAFEEMAVRLGVSGPLFTAGDAAPALRPG
jgi:hypothetical protein